METKHHKPGKKESDAWYIRPYAGLVTNPRQDSRTPSTENIFPISVGSTSFDMADLAVAEIEK